MPSLCALGRDHPSEHKGCCKRCENCWVWSIVAFLVWCQPTWRVRHINGMCQALCRNMIMGAQTKERVRTCFKEAPIEADFVRANIVIKICVLQVVCDPAL